MAALVISVCGCGACERIVALLCALSSCRGLLYRVRAMLVCGRVLPLNTKGGILRRAGDLAGVEYGTRPDCPEQPAPLGSRVGGGSNAAAR